MNTTLPAAGTEVDISIATWTVEGRTYHGATIWTADRKTEIVELDGVDTRAAAIAAAGRVINSRLWKMSASARRWFV